MRSLFFKRAKIFLLEKDGVNLRYNAIVSGGNPVPVPDWVCSTLTYKHGIADNSIIDLTPPGRKKTEAQQKAEEAASANSADNVTGKDGADIPTPAVEPTADDEDGDTDDLAAANAPVKNKLPTRTPKGLVSRGVEGRA